MIEPPRIIDIHPARATAVIHVRCTCEEVRTAMGRGVRELLDGVHAQGARPAGPLFTHHLRRPADTLDFEIGVPVDKPVGPAGRMRAGEWPAMRAARTEHRGRYEDLPQAWAAFMDWIAARKLGAAEDLWECYITGPETGSDASAWRTELSVALLNT